MRLSKEQIDIAIKLYEIKEKDTISNQQATDAYNLYLGLHNKPSLSKGPSKVKPFTNNGGTKTVLPVSVDLFKTPERIRYLTRWVINILPFIDLLSVVGELPIVRTKDNFKAFLKDVFMNYVDEIKEIQSNIPQKYNLIGDTDLLNITRLSDAILNSLNQYYQGFPNTSYDILEEAINSYITPKGYFDHILTLQDQIINKLYKMRVGTNHTYSSNEMFHIPFEMRGLVKTNRYSIPGLPCVYLGGSPLTCWEELNKPDLNTVQTSLFVVQDVSYLDFSTPPGAIIDSLTLQHIFNGLSDMEQIYNELVSYVVLWPLMAACSIRVKNPNDSFKPEYIIPQLLLQWIRHSSFDGICYFSTKVKKYTMRNYGFYKNFAFPVQDQKSEGYCSKLRDKFIITDAVPWQMFQLYKDSYLATPNKETIHTEIEFVEGMGLSYIATDFSRLETFLINKLEKS